MLTQNVEKIVDMLIDNGQYKFDDRQIIVFGLISLMQICFNIITTVMIGLFLGMLVESIYFLISFAPIRSYAGGYHAITPIKCYLLSVLIIIAVLLTQKYEVIGATMYFMGTIFSTVIIISLSPQQDTNKPLDSIEIKMYRKKAYFFLAVNMATLILTYLIGLFDVAKTISLSLFILAISLVAAKLINPKQARSDCD